MVPARSISPVEQIKRSVILETELPQAQDGSVRLLQITDTHLFASAEGRLLAVRTAESLAAVLEQVQANEHPYEVILATGDLSQDHSPESYQRFASMMAPLGRPIYWLPGNHDDSPLMTEYLHAAGISVHHPIREVSFREVGLRLHLGF